MKLQLPSVTLVCADCLNAGMAIKVLEWCKTLCDFGAVKLLTNIPTNYVHRVKIKPLNTLIMYSIFMLKEIHKYIETDRLLVVQRDGWILNTSAWDEDWLKYDYIAPLFIQMDMVGSGGFSLRSKRIMEEVSKTVPEWDWTQKNAEELQKDLPFYEDGIVSLTDFAKDFNIATLEEACKFAQGGNRNPEYFTERPFGWHRTWQKIDFVTGIVDSSDTSRDLQVGYDADIELLSKLNLVKDNE